MEQAREQMMKPMMVVRSNKIARYKVLQYRPVGWFWRMDRVFVGWKVHLSHSAVLPGKYFKLRIKRCL